MNNQINIEFVDKYIRDNNLTKIQFAEKCALSFSTIYKMFKTRKLSHYSTIIKITKVLDIPPQLLCMSKEDLDMFLDYSSNKK